MAAAPTLQRIAEAYFEYVGIEADHIVINNPENVFASNRGQMEIFFDARGITFNCYIDATSITHNPYHRIYNVTGFRIDECTNYSTGETVRLLGLDMRSRPHFNRAVDFSERVVRPPLE